jgi:hypothetical protein
MRTAEKEVRATANMVEVGGVRNRQILESSERNGPYQQKK